MTSEKLYETTCRLLRTYDSATGNTAAGAVIAHPDQFDKSPHFPFYADCASILIDCRIAMDSKTVSKTSLSAMKRVIKEAKTYNSRLAGIAPVTDEYGDVWYILSDGHRLIRLKEDYASLPHLEKPFFKTETVSDIMKAPLATVYNDKLYLPTLGEIKAHIASEKATRGKGQPILYNLPDAETWINADYLLDILQILPDCVAYKPTGNRSPIYFQSDAGDGIILPVHRNVA